MPLEETSWNLLILALIAQAQGGDVQWLAPYWGAIETWATFLITLLPFPQEQLSTDGEQASPGARLVSACPLSVVGGCGGACLNVGRLQACGRKQGTVGA